VLPVVVIVGRPNVGKSTLFNELTKTRRAIVADIPGVTRDRQFGDADYAERKFTVVDTGGIGVVDSEVDTMTRGQVEQAIRDADLILFMVDGQTGLNPVDEVLAREMRAVNNDKPVLLLVNKADRLHAAEVCADFYGLGLGEPHAIAAKGGRGLKDLIANNVPVADAEIAPDSKNIKVAFVGRPNVGKSTLINRLLGEDRVIVLDMPGTTIDTIDVEFNYKGTDYTLIDTAGIRRRSKINKVVERFSIIKSLQAMAAADVCCVLLDAQTGLNDQDKKLLGWALEKASGIVLVLNKWDDLEEGEKAKLKSDLDRMFNFSDFVPLHTISALHGTGCGELMQTVRRVYQSSQHEITTPLLTNALESAVNTHQPPLISGRRVKLRYAHIGETHPLTFIIHGKQVEKLPGSYIRFLGSYFRETFKLIGIPLHIRCINDKNPYAPQHGVKKDAKKDARKDLNMAKRKDVKKHKNKEKK
jgi:GTPase